MKSINGFSLVLVSVCVLLLAACGMAPGGGAPTPTALAGGTGSEAEAATGSEAGSEAEAGGAAGSSDGLTGLSIPLVAPTPSGAVQAEPANNAAHGSAVLVINGDLPITHTGGDCDMIGDETYLTIPPGAIPGASLVIFPGSGTTRQGTLVWATSGRPQDNAGVSAENPLIITLNEDGFSGSFEGLAYRVGGTGGVATEIAVSGNFTCISQLMRVGGAHPVDLTGVECSADPFTLRVGNPGSDAALLIAEDGATAGSTVEGGLSWRVGGVNYTTNWLVLRINADGFSGSYFGEGVGPDGTAFPVDGAFNCLGG
jgi:hypothetical protein